MSLDAAHLLAVLAIVVGAWLHGHHVATKGERAECQARERATAEAAEAQAETNRLSARSASARYVATAQRIRARLEPARQALRRDLQAPITCPAPGASHAALADLPIPAAARATSPTAYSTQSRYFTASIFQPLHTEPGSVSPSFRTNLRVASSTFVPR